MKVVWAFLISAERYLLEQDYFVFKEIFIYLAVPGLVVATRDLQLKPANSYLWPVGSSSLTRDWEPCFESMES